MGAVKIDTQAKERSLEAKYPALDSPANLRILLSDYHALINRQYQGDYDAVVLLADLSTAIEMAQLTGRQRQALRLVYEEDLTQEEAGKRLGIGRRAVGYHVEDAINAISEVYWYWSRHGEGYTVNTIKEDVVYENNAI
ncbi:sigma factor-like helix-turn-helix DNA-binding protein [Neobacillus sp. DY30]|uniref:sigma factor-like helix-turn-helix DNA-binding protein n=1 Tax=Neobacillus sp. DY30 TaxID=3047871 RepID=UPI0024C07165|nr:sigma factor-like helix-turn-helix DNA-binding protein [Neobacillus sp. DY30]WHY01857.1 sigma factor-like helix-turn-helix DNA-binding protein [Neobacillus sp. DY30]